MRAGDMSGLKRANLQLSGQMSQFVEAPLDNRIGLRCTPPVLPERLHQRGIADVLGFPQGYWKRERGDEVQQFSQSFRRRQIVRIRGEAGCFLLDALADYIFEGGSVQSDVGGGGFFEQSLNIIWIKVGPLERLLQLAVQCNFRG